MTIAAVVGMDRWLDNCFVGMKRWLEIAAVLALKDVMIAAIVGMDWVRGQLDGAAGAPANAYPQPGAHVGLVAIFFSFEW